VIEIFATTTPLPTVAKFVVCRGFPLVFIRLDTANGAKTLWDVLVKVAHKLHIHQEIVDDLVGWTSDALELGNDDTRRDDTLDTLHKTDECLYSVNLILVADEGGNEKEHLGREVRGKRDQILIAESACEVIPACEIALFASELLMGELLMGELLMGELIMGELLMGDLYFADLRSECFPIIEVGCVSG
jgi:hypothetical protein